jgi:hypothetical protein
LSIRHKIYSPSSTVQLGAGTVQIGSCVVNKSQPLLGNNADARVMATNNEWRSAPILIEIRLIKALVKRAAGWRRRPPFAEKLDLVQ